MLIHRSSSRAELKRLLYWLCTQYGRVVDIVCLKTPKMRGQAHVVFQDVAQATAAMRALQGFDFYGKPLVLMIVSIHLECREKSMSNKYIYRESPSPRPRRKSSPWTPITRRRSR